MSMSRKLQKKLFHKLLYSALALSVLSTGTAYAEEGMPQGGSVVTATAPTGFSANPVSGAAMTATANTLINWDSFNLGTGKTLTLDPNGFVFMHQVTGASQSEIQGILNGGTSGHLILANPHGIIIDGATINADHLTLTTMQNLDATGFSKLTSGGWGPEVNTNDQIVDITNSTIGVKHYLGVLAGVIMLADHVTVNTENSTIDLTAVKNGQYSLLMGKDAFYSNGVQYTNASNSIKIGDNTVLNVNGNSYNSIHILGGQVGIGDYAQLNTGSDPNMSNVLVEAVATKNDSESDSSKRYTASEDNVIHMGLVSFSNGNFALIGGKLAGETESFQDKFTKVGGETPTPPGPTPPEPPGPTPPTPPEPPGPTPPEPGSLTPEQKAQAHETANNLLDSAMNNDALKALQEAVSGSQTSSEGSNYVTIQSGGGSTGGLNIAKGLEGLTVSEAASRSRNLAKQYMQALQDGDKVRADELKQQLKDANTTVKVLKEQEKLTKEEAEKTKKATSTSQKPTIIEDYAKRFPGISELLNRPDWPQQPSEQQPQQSSGEAVVIGGSQESDALKRLNDIIGEKLLTQEADARACLRKAQTSEERQQIMKELDEIHRQETEKVNEALKKAKVAELEQKYNDPYGHYQYKVEYKLGDNQDDGSYRVNVPQDQKQREQYEAILRGQGNGDAQTGASQPPYQGLKSEMDGPDLEKAGPITEPMLSGEGTQGEPVKPGDYQEWREQNKDNLSSQQGEQRTSVETGGQSGLNIGGGERPVVETETTRPRTGASQQSTQGKISSLEQKSAERAAKEAAQQAAKDAAVKAAQEKLDQSRKDGFDKYAALQKAQYDLSLAEEKAEQAARDYLLALKSGDQYTIDAFKEELQKANDAMLEAKRNEAAAQQELKEAGANIDRARTELNNAQNNVNDSGAAGGEYQQPVQQQSGGETEAEHEAFMRGYRDAEEEWKAEQKREEAREKAEKAANDYLLALKSGDKSTIDAFKEELQKANDALLEAKRNEEAVQKRLNEAGLNIARAQTELNNAQNNVNNSSTAGGESQQTQQTVGQPSQSQQTEKHSTVENGGQSGLNIGGERPVVETETTRPRTGTSQQPAQEKTSALEQKVDDLTKQFWASVKDRDQASRDYRDAQERGASQEELDRLKARYDELEKQKDSNLAEYRAAKAEQKVDDLTKQYWEGVKDRDQAGRDYREAQERGASQEELDRLKARYDELEKQKDNNLAEYRASKAEMQSAREAADAAKNELKDAREAADTSKQKQQTSEQPVQQQGGGETITTMGGESTESDYMKGINNQLRDNLNHQEADARARLRIAVTPEAREKILKELDDIQDFRTRQGLGEYEPREPLNKDVYRDELVEKLNRQEAYGLERLRNERDMDTQTRENIIKALEEIRFERLKYGLDEGKDQFDREYEAAKASGKDMNAWLDQYQTGNKDIKAILDRRQYNNEDVKALLDRAPKGNEGYQQSGGETVITTQEPQQTQPAQ